MLWLLPLLAACATPLPPPALSSPTPPSWHEAHDARPSADIARWWSRLDEPRLTALIEQALQHNPDLAASRASLREARARLRGSAAARLPSLEAAAGAGRTKSGSADSHDNYSLGLDASWELDLFGATSFAVAAAEADARRSEARLEDAHASLAAEVALQYVALQSARQRLAIARANLASQDETLQLVEWRVRAGLASAVELEQARSSREQTAATIPQLEKNAAGALHALAALDAEAPSAIEARLGASDALPAPPPGIAVGIPADALRRRPDVRAAEQAAYAEIARSGVAGAERYPALRLSGSIGSEALTLGALGSAATLGRSLLASLSATLFDGGRLESAYQAQQAVAEQALHGYRATVLAALQEVEDALAAFGRDGEREQALAQAVEAARNAALLARQRYRSGVIDFQTVLDTERSLRTVEDARASARADRLSALIRLYKALGGGWTPADGTDTARSTT